MPVENVVIEVFGGFKAATDILNNSYFGMGVVLCGTIKALINKAAEHTKARDQFT